MTFEPSVPERPGDIECDLDPPVNAVTRACLVDAHDLLRARLVRVPHDDNALPYETGYFHEATIPFEARRAFHEWRRPRTVCHLAQPRLRQNGAHYHE